MVTCRSTIGVRVSASVTLTGVPPGGATWAVKLRVTVALAGRFTVVARGPLPLAGPVTLPPPVLPANSQLAAVTPAAGSGSEMAAPVTAAGPELLTTIV